MSAILALFSLAIITQTVWFSRFGKWHSRNLVDFDAFHIVAQLVWRGEAALAYSSSQFLEIQRVVSGGDSSFMPWTYPPQFDLALAPLGLVSVGTAYLLFTVTTLVGFVMVLRALAGPTFVVCLIVLFPVIGVTLGCGQNGFLTGTLIGLVCLSIERRPMLAGAALGLMVIKPHLAVAFALYVVLTRRWTVAATAAAVVVGSSALCTAIFGTAIWTALLQSIRDSSAFLEQGFYPMFRMVSVYASLRTSGLPAWAAFTGQIAVAVVALGIVVLAVYRQLLPRVALGLTAMCSLCVSPYAYDYDLTILGIGLALLLPTLRESAREIERSAIYLLLMFAGVYGLLRAVWLASSLSTVSYLDVPSTGGAAVISIVALILVALLRRTQRRGEAAYAEPVAATG